MGFQPPVPPSPSFSPSPSPAFGGSTSSTTSKNYWRAKINKEEAEIIPIEAVQGLNEVLGGLLKGFTYLLEGNPGSGKTTLSQLISLDLVGKGWKVLAVLLEIMPNSWVYTNREVSKKLVKAIEEGKIQVFLAKPDVKAIEEILKENITEEEKKSGKVLVIIDSVSLLWSKAPSTAREKMAWLVRLLKKYNVTAITIGQSGGGDFDIFGGAGVEHAVDVVVELRTFFSSKVGQMVRILRVKKQRYLKHSLYQHPYEIDGDKFTIHYDKYVVIKGNTIEYLPIRHSGKDSNAEENTTSTEKEEKKEEVANLEDLV